MISRSLPLSPFDFVRNISIDGDKKMYARQLTSEIDDENDLRFIIKIPSGENVAVFAEKLPWDTSFYGYGVGKLHGIYAVDSAYYQPRTNYAVAVSELLKIAGSKNIRYLFATVDQRDLATVRVLSESGFSLIEVRAYYHMNVTKYAFPERYAVRSAKSDDVMSLGRAAVGTINPYDRFHADPFIRKEDADRMMRRWVDASILEGFADLTIVPDVTSPAAFITLKYHTDKWKDWNIKLSQPVFGAVSPEFKGWYKKIISEINYHFQDKGIEHSFLCTQTNNKAVIWVWESLGYRFGKGELIFRKLLK